MKQQTRTTRRNFLAGVGAASVATLAPGAAEAKAPQPLRKSGKKRREQPVAKSDSQGTLVPPMAVRVLNRMGYGPMRRVVQAAPAPVPGRIFASTFDDASGVLGEDDVAYFNGLGHNDDERVATYVEQQLNPEFIGDTDLNQRLATYPSSFAVMNQSLGQVWAARECDPDFDDYVRPYREVEKATFTRAIYSRRQLFELMVEFWHMHFNVYAPLDRDTYVSWHSWDRDIMRFYAFGNFYEMLYASARHPTMLRYLDNYTNGRAGFNENYARELFELHTLGAENYRGLGSPLTVEALPSNPYTALNDAELNNPAYSGGLAIADVTRVISKYYVDNDVYESAKALTGWRYNDTDVGANCGSGAFVVNQNDHENSQKAVLGRGVLTIAPDQAAELEGRLVIKMAAYHPGTGTYICRKLCQRLISDNPPESVVTAAAETFKLHRRSPDQMKHVLRTILNSAEFKDPALWGQKTKRPFEYVVSAMRAAGGDYTFRQDDASNTTNDFINLYNGAGQRLFNWRTPDGYPDTREHWQGSNGLVQVWRTIDWLVDRNANTQATRVMRIIDITLANFPGNPTARQVVEFWCNWILGFSPDGGWTGPPGTPIASAPTFLGIAALRFFTQSGFNGLNDRNVWTADDEPIQRSELSINSNGYEWNSRLRGLVALILWSPNFLQR